MQNSRFKLATLALAAVACLALAPAASATTINILVGTTVAGTANFTSTGMCGSTAIGSGDVCLTVTMTGGNQVRFGGDTFGISGNVNVGGSTTIAADASGVLTIASHPCNANFGGPTLCFASPANGGLNLTTETLLLTNADINTGITLTGVHIIGPACGPATGNAGFPTCFATTGPGTTPPPVPEPGTLGLLGTGLVGIAGLVRRRFVK